jgi:hypothetical protein
MLPADASDPLLLACSHAAHTGPAYAPLLICAVFDCRTNRLQRYCRAHCARLERQAPDAPRYIESGALPRLGCPNVSQSAADRRSTLEIDNRSGGRPEHRKHADEGRISDCAQGLQQGRGAPYHPEGVSEGELKSDGYPAAANQCCQRSIAAKPFVARWRKARKYRVSPIFRRNLNRC